jgi:hypothetical protein
MACSAQRLAGSIANDSPPESLLCRVREKNTENTNAAMAYPKHKGRLAAASVYPRPRTN